MDPGAPLTENLAGNMYCFCHSHTLTLRETSRTGQNQEVKRNPIKRSLHSSSFPLTETVIVRRIGRHVMRQA